jgi:hypothetical protein
LRLLERVVIVIAAVALAIGLIALLSGFFTSRDQGALSVGASFTGKRFRDLGNARLRPGERRPAYNSNPPTSGAHLPEPVTRDQVVLTEDQLLQALAAGDVAILYGGRLPPPGLTTLARALAPPFTPALASAGETVILARRPRTRGLIGVAWAHLLRARGPSDPRLREFAAFWLGRGAPHR